LTLHEIERAAILETYDSVGTIRATAEALDISVRKVHYRLKEYREQGWLEGGVTPEILQNDPTRTRVRILLAEDDDELRWALTDLLRTEGYEVVAVADGRALFEHLGAAMLLERRDHPADVIVSDVRMPGLTGMELLESVRSRGWPTPVVLMSAFGDDDIRRRADALGAAAFLDKPIDPAKLQRVIDGVMG
jgi:DNA-binding NtrC family response regulator